MFKAILRDKLWSYVLLALALIAYQVSTWQLGFEYFYSHCAASCFLAATIFFVYFRSPALLLYSRYFWLSLYPLTFFIFYRQQAFYYWDDYDVLNHFAKSGLGGIWYSHNEHFMPLFFLTYFSETKLFGTYYIGPLLISFALHVGLAYLLHRFLRLLVGEQIGAEPAARALALLWLLLAPHVELLTWAFMQQSQLCEIFLILGMCACLKFLREGRRSQLVLAVAAAVAAPLCFGNGLRAVGLYALLAGFEWARVRVFNRRSLSLLGVTAVAGFAINQLYALYRSTPAPKLSGAIEHFSDVLAYLVTGTQLGTVLRGLGLFWSIDLEIALRLTPDWLAAIFGLEGGLSLAGVFISVVLLMLVKRRSLIGLPGVYFWLLGQAFIAVAFLLPALARYSLGAYQALSMRYQYSAAFGLTIILLPIFVNYFSALDNFRLRQARSPERLALAWVLMFGIVQLTLISNFDYHLVRGRDNRAYVRELRIWALTLAKKSRKYSPPKPDGLNPGATVEKIWGALNFLDSKKYPARNF